MTKRETVRFEMLRRVRDYGALHQAQFPEASVGAQAFAAVRAVVDDLEAQGQLKMRAVREGFSAKRQAREALSLQLDEIARTAEIVARTVPRFDDGFRLPKRENDQVLITAGRLFLEGAAAASAQFIAHGMPETFLTTLRAQLQLFEEAIAATEDGRRDSAAAKARIKETLAAGMTAVEALDVIIANQFKGDVAALAKWEQDRKQRSASRRAQPASKPKDPAHPHQPAGLAGNAGCVVRPECGFRRDGGVVMKRHHLHPHHDVHVAPTTLEVGWKVTRHGRVVSRHRTQRTAIRAGKRLASRMRVEVITHGLDGRFRSVTTPGTAPRNSKHGNESAGHDSEH